MDQQEGFSKSNPERDRICRMAQRRADAHQKHHELEDQNDVDGQGGSDGCRNGIQVHDQGWIRRGEIHVGRLPFDQ